MPNKRLVIGISAVTDKMVTLALDVGSTDNVIILTVRSQHVRGAGLSAATDLNSI